MEAGGTAVPQRVEPKWPWPEWKVRAVALPAALVVAWLVQWSGFLYGPVRIALAMPLHELGHAITAWWCGYTAIPTFWKTLIGEERSLPMTVIVAGALAVFAWLGWKTDRLWMCVAAALAGALCFLATTADAEWAQALITFAGDGGGMVLAVGLMLAFCFAGPESKLRAGYLRWGLLGIGALAFVAIASLWWHAKSDPTVIPYGEIEGVGQSDPSKLLDVYNWLEVDIVVGYVKLIEACLTGLAIGWWVAIWSARRWDTTSGATPQL